MNIKSAAGRGHGGDAPVKDMPQHTAATQPPARGKAGLAPLWMTAIALFSMVFIACADPASAKKAASSKLDSNWLKITTLLGNTKDPVASKLIVWLYATETKIPSEPRALIKFIEQNPEWPRLHAVRRKVEASITDSGLDDSAIAAWFDTHPPLSYDGIRAYLDALMALKQTTRAREALAEYWPNGELSRNQTSTLAATYKSLFAKGAMADRLDHLIWEGRHSEADTMLAFVTPDIRALGYARIALAKLAPDANSALGKVPAALKNNEGLLFERMKYRRRKDSGDSALEMLAACTGKQTRPDKWWDEIHIMARRAVERGDYRGAYRIARRHQTTEGADLAAAEWLLGWISLRYMNNAVDAYRHFDLMYRNVGSAVSRSRAAYWAALASEKLNEAATAKQWHDIAAFYPSTFYGQLSYIAVKGKPDLAALASPAITQDTITAFEQRELTRAVLLLHKVDLTRMADPFFAKMLSLAQTRDDFRLIARLAEKVGRMYYAVEANKQMQQTIGGFAIEEGYPMLPKPLPKQPDAALIHAIVHRESMFDPKAQSTVGARGLMQLMPATAKEVARKTKRSYDLGMLTSDPRYNVALGSAYLQELVERYNGYYPMAIAAYNAGPSRVSTWIGLFGDPRRGDMDALDWVEHIPIYETRNYVQRVMESYFLYRVKLGQTPKTLPEFTR